jgi:hypothetical protein
MVEAMGLSVEGLEEGLEKVVGLAVDSAVGSVVGSVEEGLEKVVGLAVG